MCSDDDNDRISELEGENYTLQEEVNTLESECADLRVRIYDLECELKKAKDTLYGLGEYD